MTRPNTIWTRKVSLIAVICMGFFISDGFFVDAADSRIAGVDTVFRADVQKHIGYAQTSRQAKFEKTAILKDDLRLRAWSRRYSAQEVKNIAIAMRVFDRASDALFGAYDARIATLQSDIVSESDLYDTEQIQKIYRAQDRLYNAYLEALYLH